jgi:uncharacterized membrane protein YhdT
LRNGIPAIYWTFRYAWSAVHIVLLIILAWLLTAYLLEDGRGQELFDQWYAWAQNIRVQLSSLIPFPWD